MSKKYDEYLTQHKANVKKGYDWFCEHLHTTINIVKAFSPDCDLNWQIGSAHDYSKSDPEEYNAYDAYFYGGNKSYEVVSNFKKAWLRHIHHNPHHWQYWILHNDDPGEGMTILEMPLNYVLEMICDWWAFSWSNGNLYEIFNWYDQHKDYMKLHERTRSNVELILKNLKLKLDELNSEVTK